MSRKTLAALAAIAVTALVVAFVWLPLERTRSRLATQLPALRASIAALEAQADEAKRLRSMPPKATGVTDPLASLVTQGGGNALPGAQIAVLDGERVRVTASDVAFGALLEWLAAAQSAQGLRVESAQIDALAMPGRVRAELRLTRS